MTLLSLLIISDIFGQQILTVKAEKGEGIYALMKKYGLDVNICNLKLFYALNDLDPSSHLQTGKSYQLPITYHAFDGITIRSTLNIKDYSLAKQIEKFNFQVVQNKLKLNVYTKDRVLWVPAHLQQCKIGTKVFKDESSVSKPKEEENTGIVGSDSDISNKPLKNKVYYIKGGHGGPDPGAMAKVQDHICCEDEYAYDVALRLGKLLSDAGGTVIYVVYDKDDGIRNDTYLKCDKTEKQSGGKDIPLNQLRRLKGRTEFVNAQYMKYKKLRVSDQIFISIHIDSRSKNLELDSHFYYFEGSKSGYELAKNVQNVFAEKYEKQLNKSYTGTIKGRDLYVLKYSYPTALFVE